MHDAGAVLGGDEVAGQHLEAVGGLGEERKRRQVPQAQQLLPGVAAEDFRFIPQFPRVGGQALPGQHEPTTIRNAGTRYDDVLHSGVDRDGLISRQGPRCGGPDQQIAAVQTGTGCGDRESDGDGRILATLVDVIVHPQFMAGQRSLIVPAVRQHPHALVGQPLVP